MSEDRSTHPTPEELRALSLGQLAEAELDRICDHLDDCPDCCRLIDQPAAADPLLALVQQSAAGPGEALVSRAQRRSAVHALRRGHAEREAAQRGDPETEPVILSAPQRVGGGQLINAAATRGAVAEVGGDGGQLRLREPAQGEGTQLLVGRMV